MNDISLPEIGEGIEKALVINVFISNGDPIKKEQPVIEIETDKAAIELPSPYDGTVQEVLVSVGDSIKIGQVIAKVDGGAEAAKKAPVEKKTEEVKKEKQPQKDDIKPVVDRSEKKDRDETQPPSSESEKEPDATAGKTADKEVKKKEVKKKDDKIDNIIPITKAEKTGEEKTPVPAAPSTRKLARQLGVDISKVSGTGPGGRISTEDVLDHAKSIVIAYDSHTSTHRGKYEPHLPELPDFTKWGEIEKVKMTTVRRLTAENLSMAWTIPHVTQHDKADITELDELRKKNKQKAKDAGGNLTITPILIKVVASALKVFPEFNASIDIEHNEIIYKKFVNIGFAVDSDRGLFVPNIRNADHKNIIEIASELSDLSDRVRKKKITPDELKGSTFTVSNLGGVGGTYFSPIIYYPDVAILGVSQSNVEPLYVDGKFEPRLMVPLSLSYDHRIIDGVAAAEFLRWIVRALEEPFKILFEGH